MIIRSIISSIAIGVLFGVVGNLEAAEPTPLKLDLADAYFVVRAVPGSGEVQIDSSEAVGPVKLKRKSRPSHRQKVEKIQVRGTKTHRREPGSDADRPHGRLDTIYVSIPRDRPLDLALIVHRGESDIDLGGLTLTGLRVEMLSGEHALNFGQPLRGNLTQATARASRGDFELTGLANVRAPDFVFKGSAGDWELVFDGEWDDQADLTVHLKASMGDLNVRLPRSVRLLESSSSRAFMGDSAKHEIERAVNLDETSGPGMLLRMRMTMGDSSLSRF